MTLTHKILQSKIIPDYLDVTSRFREKQVKAKLQKEQEFKKRYASGRLAWSEAKQRLNFIDHKFGVLEESDTGVVWYREGDSIFRQEDDYRENIIEALQDKTN